jgi:hypothetical protein
LISRWLALTSIHGTPVVKPACVESSHCTGVRALSRLIAASDARTSSSVAHPYRSASAWWFSDSMSRYWSMRVKCAFVIPSSSPW